MAYRRKKIYYSKDEIINALINNNGFITYAAKELNMTPQGLSRRVKHGADKEEFEKVLKSIRESNLDITENKFREKIDEGDVQCILYHLKTHGKTRGYGNDTKLEIDKNLNWKIEIVHNVDDDDIKKIDEIKSIESYAENTNPTEV